MSISRAYHGLTKMESLVMMAHTPPVTPLYAQLVLVRDDCQSVSWSLNREQ